MDLFPSVEHTFGILDVFGKSTTETSIPSSLPTQRRFISDSGSSADIISIRACCSRDKVFLCIWFSISSFCFLLSQSSFLHLSEAVGKRRNSTVLIEDLEATCFASPDTPSLTPLLISDYHVLNVPQSFSRTANARWRNQDFIPSYPSIPTRVGTQISHMFLRVIFRSRHDFKKIHHCFRRIKRNDYISSEDGLDNLPDKQVDF